MSTDAVYIALLQINIALGCLYNGLPAARYRTKLYDVIVGIVNSVPDYARMADRLQGAVAHDAELAKGHHLVRRWIAALPESHQQRIRCFDKLNLGETSPDELPLRYRWYFGKNLDKVATWLITVGASLFFMWAAYLDNSTGIGAAIAALGQLVPAANVWSGRRMIHVVGREVRKRFDELVYEYQQTGVSKAVGSAEDALR